MVATVRTNRSVHLHSLLKEHYNLIIIHHLADDESLTTFIPELEALWAKDHDGHSIVG